MKAKNMKSRPSARKNKYLRVFSIAIILVITSGWLFTNFLVRVSENEFKEKVDREANIIAFSLHDQLNNVESSANVLSRSEQLEGALFSGDPVDLERANRLLDRINSSMKLSVCYLLDRNGLAVASSNRKEKTNFVGKPFDLRPFFTGAMTGRLTTYFALGVITHERGFFAAAPVVGSSGTITGVVVVKKNVAPVGELLQKHTHAFLVSPDGIIFISSKKDLLYRSLWPVDEGRRSKLLSSQQFGNITFEPLVASELKTGTYVRLEDEEHYVLRLPFGSDGWSIVLLDDPHTVSTYRLFGIILTGVFVLLLLLFLYVLLYKNKSLEATRDLLKSRGDWKRTFDAVPDLIALIDKDYRLTSMNKAMAEQLGISQEEAVGRRCYELLYGSQEQCSSCPHQGTLELERTGSGCHFVEDPNGNFNVTSTQILAEDGTIESYVHVMHNISELKRLERSQKEYAQRLEFVLKGSDDATWEWDLIADKGVINTKYYEMTEYTPGEIDLTFAFLMTTIHPDDVSEVQRLMKEHLEGKNGKLEAHFRIVTKSGKLKYVMMRGKIVIHDEDGRPLKIAGVVTDVSKMKRLSDEVNRVSNLESIGLLSGGLAHDFNNVLNIIYGNITFVKMLAEGNAALLEPLTDVEEACERAMELGTRLQALSLGGIPFREHIMLPPLLEDLTEVIFKDTHISHSIAVADDIHALEADPRQIKQMFENLLTNAKEAMPGGGAVKINIKNCEVDGKEGLSLRSGPYVCITIQDDGSGIPVVNLPKIFDPYFSTKDTYNKRGLGLGLSICHAVMKRHNGQISVESSVGIGTRVTMYLPASVEGENSLHPRGN